MPLARRPPLPCRKPTVRRGHGLTARRGLADRQLAGVEAAPGRQGRLVASALVPAVARVHLLHLFRQRRLAIVLARSLTDATWVCPDGSEA
ncbi:hypothetical protein GCM10010236_09740 [Streptomyces eurythermus]|nr:hypothetical protein GCM10010236_09740 [Streptomyces eurythermus]